MKTLACTAGVGRQIARPLDHVRTPLEIGSRTKHLSRAGQDHRANLIELTDLIEGCGQLVVKGSRERVNGWTV